MRFKELFHGERFAALREAGAPVQRPLWASTGVKDPLYPETKYVDSLVAPDTVNTMPMPTLLACAEQLEVSGHHGRPGPGRRPEAARGGRDRHGRRDEEAAPAGHRQVRRAVRRPDRAASSSRARGSSPGGRRRSSPRSRTTSSRRSSSAIRKAQAENVAKRVWARDESLWGGPGVAEIGNRLGWLTISDKMLEHAGELHAFAEAARADGLEHAVLLGMGGSSLGPEVIRRSYGEVPDGMRLHVLDSTDPGAVLATERAVDLDKTLFIVSSKSGGTIETLSHMRYFFERTGGDGSRFCAVTDPGSPLIDAGARARLPQGVRERPGHRRPLLGAVVLRARAGGARGREHRGHAPPGAGGRAELRAVRLARVELRAVARLRDGRAGPAGPRQAHLRRSPSRSRASGSGSSS